MHAVAVAVAAVVVVGVVAGDAAASAAAVVNDRESKCRHSVTASQQ